MSRLLAPCAWLRGVAALAALFAVAGCAEGPTDEQADATSATLAQDPIKRSLKKVPGEYIVLLKDGGAMSAQASASAVNSAADGLVARHGGVKKLVFNRAVRGFSARMSDAQARKLAADPTVALVEENAEVRTVDVQPNPTWGLDRVDQRDLPFSTSYDNRNLTGAGVTVYVIDTGIRTTHQEFEGRATVGADYVFDGRNGQDGSGHGTHVAGTVASKSYGVAKQAQVVSVRVLNDGGFGLLDAVIAGVDWVTAHHAPLSVANMSLGSSDSAILDQAVKSSIASGVVYVVAAGNSDSSQVGSPARVSEALVVGATDSTDTRASFSNYGPALDMFAPGEDILSTWRSTDHSTSTISGTSMAAPHVAGLAALYRQANPSAAPAVIHDEVVGAGTVGKVANPGAGSPNRLAYIAHDPAGSGSLLTDNFESGGSQWQNLGGTWSLVSDGSSAYQGSSTSGYARVSAGSTAWTDQAVEARVKMASISGSDRFVLLAARLTDANNYYYAALRSSGKVELKRLKANSATTLVSKNLTVNLNTWYTVKLEVVGTTLKLYVNGVLQLTATDTNFGAGKVGLGAYYATARFDDVAVTGPNTSATASNPYPADTNTGADPSAPLTWMAGTGAVSHDVYLGTSTSPSLVANVSRSSFKPTGLASSTTYYWRVNERTAGGTVVQGPVWRFTTGAAPGAASTPSPANASSNASLSPTLTWSSGAGAETHLVHLGRSPNPEFYAPAWDPTISLYNLDHSTTYYWRVDEQSGAFTTPGPVWSFTTGNPQGLPGYASAPSPAEGASNVPTKPTLSWQAGASAVRHDVYVADFYGERLVASGPQTSITAPALLAESAISWRVDEIDAQGRLTRGRWWSFLTGSSAGAPSKPVNVSPANQVWGVSETPTLSWTASSGAVFYDVWVEGGEDYDSRFYTTTQTSLSIGPLDAGWDYYFRVIAWNENGAAIGNWSSFDTRWDPSAPPPGGPASAPSPANGATGTSTTPTLSLTLGPGGTNAVIFLGTSPTELKAVSYFSPSYLAGDLEPATTYYWRADTVNGGGRVQGPLWSFTTGQRVLPAAAGNPVPSNNATGVSNNLQLEWSRGSGATSHLLYFGETATPDFIGRLRANDTMFFGMPLQPNRTYYWRVDEQNAAGVTPGQLWTFTTGAAIPAGPTYSGPANHATGVSLTPTLSWGAVPGATSYKLWFGLTNQTQLYTTTATTFTPSTPLIPGQDYMWQVTAVNSTGEGWGETWYFRTTPVTSGNGPAWNPSPRSWQQDVGFTPTLTWNAGQGAVSHDVYWGVGDRANLTRVSTQSGTSYSPGPLLSEYVYYWRVDERDSAGNVTPGQTWLFFTGLADGSLTEPASNPSPVSGKLFASTRPTLTFSPAAGATAHEVYFQEYNEEVWAPPRVALLSPGVTSYAPGLLKSNTRYVWFIGERNAAGTRLGPTWSFTTGSTEGVVPEPATQPSPEREAFRVPTNALLSWSAGAGAASHDVYFGTSSSPPYVGNVATASYEPALQPYTTYYWRIDERNAAGVRPGTLWSFSTGGQTASLPGLPSSPEPLDQATAVSLTPSLEWIPGESSTSQDVYFGTNATGNLPFVGNQSAANSFYEPDALLPNTTYYWRIDARNAVGVRQGQLWRFTTLSDLLTLLSDNFEDGDAAGWTVHSTAWSLLTDGSLVYRATNTSGYARASAGLSTWSDQAVEARLKAISWSGSNRFALVGARFVDINNYYYVALRTNNTIELKRLVANAPTTLASKSLTFSTGSWYEVKLEAVGSTLRVYVDDVLQLSATDSTFATGKMVIGVWNGTAEFDDIRVTDP